MGDGVAPGRTLRQASKIRNVATSASNPRLRISSRRMSRRSASDARSGVAVRQTANVVGARGFEPAIPTCRIVVPSWIADALV